MPLSYVIEIILITFAMSLIAHWLVIYWAPNIAMIIEKVLYIETEIDSDKRDYKLILEQHENYRKNNRILARENQTIRESLQGLTERHSLLQVEFEKLRPAEDGDEGDEGEGGMRPIPPRPRNRSRRQAP